MKKIFTLLFCVSAFISQAQKFTGKSSSVVFFSKAAIENITAKNTKSSSLYNTLTREIVFVIPIADFDFEKSLMKEHFNEKYMESEKFPKATFQGKVDDFNPKVKGKQTSIAKGTLTIHGVAKPVELSGTMEMVKDTINLHSKFIVKLADYNISIPTLMFKKIAEQVEVTVDFSYKPL